MHREVGAYAAFKNTDVLVCIGALSKDMAEAAKETVLATEKNMKVFHFDTKKTFTRTWDRFSKKMIRFWSKLPTLWNSLRL